MNHLFDHLWQSTLFVGVAWLLTLTLRRNHARVRHWVWMAASCKFLIPLSALIAMGGHVQWRTVPEIPQPNLYFSYVMEEVSQPFTSPAASTTPAESHVPALLAGLWLCGSLGIACSWWIRWRRIRTVVRAASPVQLDLPIQAMSSPTLLEPGVFGIFRPVLLLPEGILNRLTPEQLKAILAHELCHIRNRDNLIAAIHMFVETVFWFHPLVWWIGKRMVAERERACDEEVVRMGNEPRAYAEGILNVCKLYVESPLACVSGVTGADLKKRIEKILGNTSAVGLNLGKKLALGVAGITALAAPIIIGVLNAPAIRAQDAADWQIKAGGKMAFEVASVKLDKGPFRSPNFPLDTGDAFTPGNRFSADMPLLTYIHFAYKVNFSQQQAEFILAHWPKWIDSDRYAVDARAGGTASKDQMRLMMQALLADRFRLEVHFETQETAVMALKLVKSGKTGPKLIPHSEGPACEDPSAPAQQRPAGGTSAPFPERCYVQELSVNGRRFHTGARNTTMEELVGILPGVGRLGRPVVDQTGISGRIDYEMEWTREPGPGEPPATKPPDEGPSFLDALREQLGLRVESAKAPLRVLVIDHLERPSEN